MTKILIKTVMPVLSVVEEDHLAHGLVYLSECGVPQGRRVLKDMVASFLKAERRPNPFKENVPGKDWIKGFETRNRAVLTRRKPNFQVINFVLGLAE